MLDEFLVGHIWAGPALCAILYCSDRALTMRCARLLRAGADKHFVFPVYELNPRLQKDVAQLRGPGPRLWIGLALSCLFPVLLWTVISQRSPPEWDIYRTLLGVLVLGQVALHLRHFSNLAAFWHARDSRGYRGQICVATWLSYRLSALQFVTYAALYLFLFALNFNWYFVGGAFPCVALAVQHWRLSRKHFAKDAAARTDEPVQAELP
ncbi:MAG: hypothetical protein ACLQLG_14325 [Thermoguttaceae bacterium]